MPSEYLRLLKVISGLITSDYKRKDFIGVFKDLVQAIANDEVDKLSFDSIDWEEFVGESVEYLESIRDMKIVQSSNIERIGYNKEDEHLFVEFVSSDLSLYRYFGVPENVFKEFKDADSKGSYFHKEIKGNYSYEKVA